MAPNSTKKKSVANPKQVEAFSHEDGEAGDQTDLFGNFNRVFA